MRKIDKTVILSTNYKEGIKTLTKKKKSIKGDLEHFDESLKKTDAWLWENLFIVDTHTNCRVKGTKSILKPDSKEYNPFKYLELYLSDEEDNIYSFKANSNLSEEKQEDVEYMIDTLGLNCIEDERSRQLREWKDKYELGLQVEAYRYITAWEMTLKNLRETNAK